MSASFSIAVHGGVVPDSRTKLSSQLESQYHAALELAVKTGHAVLERGGDALEAVRAAVVIMEDCPLFNAGKGSILTCDEMVEMDACVMHGESKQVGAITGVRHIKNPILLAKNVLKYNHHGLLAGEGAENFAFQHGHQYIEQDYFFTEPRYEQLQAVKEALNLESQIKSYGEREEELETDFCYGYPFGSVGAVALDQFGNLAAASSGGGIPNKLSGAVGDSAVIGAATYAENSTAAVSCAGAGLSGSTAAIDVAARMRYLDLDIHTASRELLTSEQGAVVGYGLIAIDGSGDICCDCNGASMYYASIDTSGVLRIKC